MVCAHGNGKQGRWYFQQALAKGSVRHGCVFYMRCTPTEFMTPVAPGEVCAWWSVIFVQVGEETAMVLCQDHLIKRAKPWECCLERLIDLGCFSERSSCASSSSSTVTVSSISRTVTASTSLSPSTVTTSTSSWPWIKLDEIECARNVD